MEKRVQFSIWYFIAALLAVVWIRQFWVQARTVEPITYSEFQAYLREGKIEEVTIGSETVEGKFRQPLPGGRTRFVAVRVEPELARDLEKHSVRFSGAVESNLLQTLLSWIVPALVFFGVWMLLMRRFAQGSGMGGGFLSIGKSKAKIYVESDVKTTFDDVAGVDEAKEELREVVGFLRDPVRYGRLGGRVPKGVLLVGPPGTGKTLLARALAGEAGVAFLSISGSEFVEMFVGVGAARVRDLFEQARSKAPCIIFIDELDALGRARGAFGVGGHDEKEQTLNQLLSELDGFDPSRGIVLLAATNRPEVLDPALLRAGRFDRQILVDRPDRKGRIEILAVHLKRIRLAPEADAEKIAALTPGFSGADLANLVNEAALLATRRGAEGVEMQDFTGAVERIVAGLEKKNRLLNPLERKVVAHHEMGHALVALALPGSDPVHKISIIPRGVGALGYTIQRPTEDRYLMTRAELENKMAVLLGGRAAEALVFDHLSTGAADDLVKATEIARAMVMRYGMVESLGHVAYRDERSPFLAVPGAPAPRDFSEQTAAAIDEAVRRLVGQAYERARELLRVRRAQLERGAELLLQKETIGEDELRAIAAPPRAAA
jgi:cell division protease FtsH